MNVSNGFWVIVGVLMHSQSNSTWCEELTHLKRPWCWERLRAGGEEDDRGWDGWMIPPAEWTWDWVDSRNWWWTGRPGVLRFMGLQRVRRLSNWTELMKFQIFETWKLKICKYSASHPNFSLFATPRVQFISKSYLLHRENIFSLSSLGASTLLP